MCVIVDHSVDPALTPDPVGVLPMLSDTGDRGLLGCGARSFLVTPGGVSKSCFSKKNRCNGRVP